MSYKVLPFCIRTCVHIRIHTHLPVGRADTRVPVWGLLPEPESAVFIELEAEAAIKAYVTAVRGIGTDE